MCDRQHSCWSACGRARARARVCGYDVHSALFAHQTLLSSACCLSMFTLGEGEGGALRKCIHCCLTTVAYENKIVVVGRTRARARTLTMKIRVSLPVHVVVVVVFGAQSHGFH